ncbi:MAG TPA: DUF1559 domain-containing protein [Pirellulaceae bacterium]|nr:DUF1559 domain-containing protein [Pirellulaceae bacterium]
MSESANRRRTTWSRSASPAPTWIEWLTILGILGVVGAFLWPMFAVQREVDPPQRCQHLLKQIAVSLHAYHDNFGCFPPAYIADSTGRPMHSWRVLLLPYMEEKPLYDQYRFDEPWDGPHNRRLASAIVRTYCGAADHAGPRSTETDYVAIVGPRTMWPEEGSVAIGDLEDGPAQVVAVVEVHNSGIHWMEPRDLHANQMAPKINAPRGQGISSEHAGGAYAATADGAVRFLKDDTPADVLRSWIQIDDGTLPLP